MGVNWATPCANCIFFKTESIIREHGEEMWNCYCEDGNDEVLGSKYGCWHYEEIGGDKK